jgi:hypothetical protein
MGPKGGPDTKKNWLTPSVVKSNLKFKRGPTSTNLKVIKI